MIRSTTFIAIIIFMFSCNHETDLKKGQKKRITSTDSLSKPFVDNSIIDSSSTKLLFQPNENYNIAISKINIQRIKFQQELNNANDSIIQDSIINSAKNYFSNALLNKIIPHWYGTTWDFDGYTNTPNKGLIACGYFVSTTLKHIGLNINRYKMAQQAGLNEARTLEPNSKLLIYKIEYSEELENVFIQMKKDLLDGLYFVGLSNHVGYIYVINNELYFIHSNYISGYVMLEKAEYSDAFISSIYVIADITHNNYLIRNWINEKNIPVLIQ